MRKNSRTPTQKKGARYYPEDALELRSVTEGAKMWSAALEKTQLTYFEVEPGCTFATHKHESEQITMVLEGELFFKVEGRSVCVKKGEVMALPSGLPHSVFTAEKPARAVDAWSPVMEEYQNKER